MAGKGSAWPEHAIRSPDAVAGLPVSHHVPTD